MIPYLTRDEEMIAPFPTPIMFTAWGTSLGGQFENSYGVLRDLCIAEGFKTIALQVTQCRRQQVRDLHDAGLFVVGWDEAQRFTKSEFDALGFDGYMPQIETPDQYDAAVGSLALGVGEGLAKGVVTTYAGLFDLDDPRNGRRWAVLASLGVSACFTECYAAESTIWADLDRMIHQGVIYGIPAGLIVPVCGVYRGELPSAYQGLSTKGREFGCYIAEPMSAAQWKAWGGVNKVTQQVYYWRLVSGVQTLHEERAITHPDKTTGYSRMLEWMHNHRDRVASAKSVELAHVLDDPH